MKTKNKKMNVSENFPQVRVSAIINKDSEKAIWSGNLICNVCGQKEKFNFPSTEIIKGHELEWVYQLAGRFKIRHKCLHNIKLFREYFKWKEKLSKRFENIKSIFTHKTIHCDCCDYGKQNAMNEFMDTMDGVHGKI